MFAVLRESSAEDRAVPVEVLDCDADESQATYHSFTHFIKPDMLMNIYSLIDFWMNRIFEYQKDKMNLDFEYRDLKKLKGNNDLDNFRKFLEEYTGIDPTAVQASIKHLDDLRKVRNRFIHAGGHVLSGKEADFLNIKGISLFMSLIIVDDSFIWDSLEHAKKYLQAATLAEQVNEPDRNKVRS